MDFTSAARLARSALSVAMDACVVGGTNEQVDQLVHAHIVRAGAYPAAVNFHGFPKSLCASPNNVACHGIPDARCIEEGDLVSYDCTVYVHGVFGDCCGTVVVGQSAHAGLSACAHACTMAAVAAVGPGERLSAVGEAIHEVLGMYGGRYTLVKDFSGHFIGRQMHMAPLVPHVRTAVRTAARKGVRTCVRPSAHDIVLQEGDVFTIEPIICEGSGALSTWPDGWTVVTTDGGWCAQWEHTVLINAHGAEVLTL
eukprot:GHVS01004048.1.p1 GENE.GHVS01004048.1~~GHVS01004048.1.p1  ORF type:complete len:254 (-),score=47.64 GHVS01004048.1:96-857(-)